MKPRVRDVVYDPGHSLFRLNLILGPKIRRDIPYPIPPEARPVPRHCRVDVYVEGEIVGTTGWVKSLAGTLDVDYGRDVFLLYRPDGVEVVAPALEPDRLRKAYGKMEGEVNCQVVLAFERIEPEDVWSYDPKHALAADVSRIRLFDPV